MIRVALVALASCLLVPASAGTSGARPPAGLTASPTRVALAGADRTAIRISNSGRTTAVVDASLAGFALDLRGRPRVVRPGAPRTAVPWLALEPRRVTLRPGASAWVTVSSRLPSRAEPGDHDALVLLSTVAPSSASVAVRMRLGVVVVVRAPGAVVRDLRPLALSARRVRSTRVLELLVANRGNVTERSGSIRLELRRPGGRTVGLRPVSRDLRPRTRGIVRFVYRGPWRGPVTARVEVKAGSGSLLRRSYRIRL